MLSSFTTSMEEYCSNWVSLFMNGTSCSSHGYTTDFSLTDFKLNTPNNFIQDTSHSNSHKVMQAVSQCPRTSIRSYYDKLTNESVHRIPYVVTKQTLGNIDEPPLVNEFSCRQSYYSNMSSPFLGLHFEMNRMSKRFYPF